jgi:hypothetical protein
MARAAQTFRIAVLPITLLRIVDATMRVAFGARTRKRQADRHRAGSLDAIAMRDIGACREYQDYACSADAPASAAMRLHRIADATRYGLPR